MVALVVVVVNVGVGAVVEGVRVSPMPGEKTPKEVLHALPLAGRNAKHNGNEDEREHGGVVLVSILGSLHRKEEEEHH